MIKCVQWDIDTREKVRRGRLNFSIPLNTSDHCLSILEHDHPTTNMPISLILFSWFQMYFYW